MTSVLPLSTLLSHLLVAFTIEFDNEFEHQMPHRTSNRGGSPNSPWLVSLVMWSNCMRFVGVEGVRVAALKSLARTETNLHGMQRWGYIAIEPDPADARPKPPRSQWLIRPTPAGQKAQQVWRPLFATIENRWQLRFGKAQIHQLRHALCLLIGQMELALPDCLPILWYGLFSKAPDQGSQALTPEECSHLTLPSLLSRVLLAFAIDFERESSACSLAISSNVLRILDEKGVRVRDLPLLSGVSKESINMALGILKKTRLAVVASDQDGGRTKFAGLTPKGLRVQEAHLDLLRVIETRWKERFGAAAISQLRTLLERLVGEPTAEASPLFQGLEPYPDGWRASIPRPKTLPHYPMVTHRGGFPDGS
jgi:DNA-binding MarR family transcriptional regulator